MKFTRVMCLSFLLLFLSSCLKSDEEKYYLENQSMIEKYALLAINDYRESWATFESIEYCTFTVDSITFLSARNESNSVTWYYKMELTRVEIESGDIFYDSILYYGNEQDFEDSDNFFFVSNRIYNGEVPSYYVNALANSICFYEYLDSDIKKLDYE